MSVIPASRLTSSDLALLGNNFGPVTGRPARAHARRRRVVRAVNRSLAAVGEAVRELHAPVSPRR